MLTEQIKTTLKEAGQKIKRAVPDLTGQVTFNFSHDHPEPKVTIMACDVTKEEKKIS